MNLTQIAIVVLFIIGLILALIFKGKCGKCNKLVLMWQDYGCTYYPDSGLGGHDCTLETSYHHLSCPRK